MAKPRERRRSGTNEEGVQKFFRDFESALVAFTDLVPGLIADPAAQPHLALAADQIKRRSIRLLARRRSAEELTPLLPDLNRALQQLQARISDLNLQSLALTGGRPRVSDTEFGRTLAAIPRDRLPNLLQLRFADPLTLSAEQRTLQLRFFPATTFGIWDTVRAIKDAIFVLIVIALIVGDLEVILDMLEYIEEEWGEYLDWVQWLDDILEFFATLGKATGGGGGDPPPPPGNTNPPSSTTETPSAIWKCGDIFPVIGKGEAPDQAGAELAAFHDAQSQAAPQCPTKCPARFHKKITVKFEKLSNGNWGATLYCEFKCS